MKLWARVFLGYFLIVGLSGWFLLRVFVSEVKPGVRDAVEDVVLGEVPQHGGDGGAIAVDGDGNLALILNTHGMYRGWVRSDGTRGTAIYQGD